MGVVTWLRAGCAARKEKLFMTLALLIARLVLSLVFLVAGLTKLADRTGSRQALLDFGVPARLARPGGLRSVRWPSCCCSSPASPSTWRVDAGLSAIASGRCTPSPLAGPRCCATWCWLLWPVSFLASVGPLRG